LDFNPDKQNKEKEKDELDLKSYEYGYTASKIGEN
jgi:hypothetical protein